MVRISPVMVRPGVDDAAVMAACSRAVPATSSTDGHIRQFLRSRANRKADGTKLVRLLVPDPRSPEFVVLAERQAAALRGAPEEQDALDFIEAAMRDLDLDARSAVPS